MKMNPSLVLRDPFGHAPARRANSIRRTSSLDFTWPNGRGAAFQVEGHARDVFTPGSALALQVLAFDELRVAVSVERVIESIACAPHRPGIEGLVGRHHAKQLRAAVGEALAQERDAGSPLHLLLDDLPGASVVAPWVWSQWQGDGPAPMHRTTTVEIRFFEDTIKSMEGVCLGHKAEFRRAAGFTTAPDATRPVQSLVDPADPRGWHALPAQRDPSMRRARRLDVWVDDVVNVEGMFQDSATTPGGGRRAVHEYSFEATLDPVDLTLRSVHAVPRVLPYPECPQAILNLDRLVGLPVSSFRRAVLEKLRREDGCTHLNDAMRGLADVPSLLRRLSASARGC